MTQQEYEQKRCECWHEYFSADKRLTTAYEHKISKEAFYAAFDRAYALGKQEKDTDTVTIDKEEYDELCKYRRYVANWVPYFNVCPICGEYNQSGCICANCGNNKNWNNGE